MAAPKMIVNSSSLPAEYAEAVTPSDTVGFSTRSRGIYVGVSGDVVAVMNDGTAITFKNANSGSILPVRCIRVNATGTTATNLVGLF